MSYLYTPLDESKDEIRLIKLAPKNLGSEIVQCKLETRSLISLTAEYESFMTTASFSNTSKTQTMDAWSRSRSPQDQASTQDQDHVHSHTPREDCYRFAWGDYAALSYVWGDEKDTRKIIVNGLETQVTYNLEVALRAFRDRSEFGSGFQLWVDAISINQQDLAERGRQVRRMRDIYGKAWTVVAWLGEEGDGSDKAIQLVQKLSEFSVVNTGQQLETRLRETPGYLGDGCWFALNELMERTYWCRLWIIQEIIMGASAMVIRCGNGSIDWESFCAGIGLLQEHLWLVKNPLLQRDAAGTGFGEELAWTTTSLHLVYRDLSVLSQSDEHGAEGLIFWKLLDIANSADCSDPRDKVYGLVGMMGNQIAKQLIPDYTMPTHEVYTEISKTFIQGYKTLDPIREGNPWGPTKTPSWVADWQWEDRLSQARIENSLWGPSWLSGKSVPNSSAYVPYQASGQSPYEISFSGSGLLNCSGFVIDSISGLSARGNGFFAWSKTSIKQAKQWKSTYGDVINTSIALYRTLLADRVGGGQRPSERHAVILNLPSTFQAANPQFEELGWKWMAAQEDYYFRWEYWRLANRNFMLGDRRLDDYFSDVIPADASEYDFTEVYCCFDRTCQKRRFMLTKNGYMGWAPDNIFGSAKHQTMEGDLIAIVFGCSTPIVIRPFRAHFKVVGEAYVHGLMDGEGMEFLKMGKVKTQSFTFC